MAASRGSVLATSLGAGGAGRCDGLTLRPKPILGGSGRRFGVAAGAAGAVGTAGAAGGSSGAVRPKDTFTDASGRIATVISRGNGKPALGQKIGEQAIHSSVGQGRPLRPRTLQCNLKSQPRSGHNVMENSTPKGNVPNVRVRMRRRGVVFSTEQRTAQPTSDISLGSAEFSSFVREIRTRQGRTRLRATD